MNTATFYQMVEDWSISLAQLIADLRSRNKTVYLVALSRKMPRFLTWVSSSSSLKAVELRQRLMDSAVHIVTELAIPLLFVDIDEMSRAQFAGIIVDDAVIEGSTLANGGREWLTFAGSRPYYSAVFENVDAVIPSFFQPVAASPNYLMNEELIEALTYISGCILASSLPVDIEYPIVYINAPYEEIRRHMEDNLGEKELGYEVNSCVNSERVVSYSIMLPDERTDNFNNDFAKVRLFPDSNNRCKMEVIAPNEIMEDYLQDKDYFETPEYKEIWNYLLEWIYTVPINQEELDRSYQEFYINLEGRFTSYRNLLLVVLLNYLLSISAFIRHLRKLLPDNVEFAVSEEDLQMIVGSLSTELRDKINALLREELVSVSKRFPVRLPRLTVSDKEFELIYLKNIYERINSELTLEKCLDIIFSLTHFTSGLVNFMGNGRSYHRAVGETFESLSFILDSTEAKERDIRINRWIDRRIDESRITPKYYRVMGSDDKYYYRRYFFSGTNPIPQS